jgi:hypothetical protein
VIAFFDASALIYLIEGAEPFATKWRKELAATAKRHPAWAPLSAGCRGWNAGWDR